MIAYFGDLGHPFRLKLAIYSVAKRPVIGYRCEVTLVFSIILKLFALSQTGFFFAKITFQIDSMRIVDEPIYGKLGDVIDRAD